MALVQINNLPAGVTDGASKLPMQLTGGQVIGVTRSQLLAFASGGYPVSPNEAPIPAVNANTTFAGGGYSQGQIDAAYGGSFAVTTDNIDWAALQYTVNQSCNNGTPMCLRGNYFMGSKDITMPKIVTSNKFTIYGFSNLVTFAGGKGWTRTRPASLAESQTQQNTSMYFHHVRLAGSGAGTGFEPAANTNSIFENLFIEGFATGAIFRTTQNGNIISIDIRDCANGSIVRNEEALVGSEAQTQSNGTNMWHPRIRHSVSMTRGIQYFASYQGTIFGAQIEGNGSIQYGIFFDALGLTTVKNFDIFKPHFESTSGFTGAAIYVKMREGTCRVFSAEHDIADTVGGLGNNLLMVEAESTVLSPSLIIDTQNINKWSPAAGGPFAGKYFNNTQCRWNMYLWSNVVPSSTFFAGTACSEVAKLSNVAGNNFSFF